MKITEDERIELERVIYSGKPDFDNLLKWAKTINPSISICKSCPSSIGNAIRLIQMKYETGGFTN